ncbi:MAG: hypothetical protein ACE5E9_02295 [Nitrospinaceae bacterium]
MILWGAAVLWLLMATGAGPMERDPSTPTAGEIPEGDPVPLEEIANRALKDSLYYKFDKWFDVFQKRIETLEALPRTLENRIELMTYNFYYAGLLGELCHSLAFSSKYRIKEISDRFLFYSSRSKEIAREILDHPELAPRQEAQTYLILGAAEGYIGIFEYGEGHLLTALINGFQADNHLEKALLLDPSKIDAHFGLGIYRYGNSRLGGLGNLIMQGGRDLRRVGLEHIELAIRNGAPSRPLALKTLVWFYISEQINPDNAGIPPGQWASVSRSRARAVELMDQFESLYFKNPPYKDFKGSKELALMRAIQFVLDEDYSGARKEFVKIIEISEGLRKKGFAINPQLTDSIQAGIKFCDLMLHRPAGEGPGQIRSACLKINDELAFLNGGGSLIEYDAKKIRSDLHSVFLVRLNRLSRQMKC